MNFLKNEDVSTRLALSYVVHHSPGLFEILLHLTFRPYNSYCIYVDAKTDEETKRAFQNIINCYKEMFPNANIFLIKTTQEIVWGSYSLLNADLTCLEELIKSKK